jgi:formate hydrogenlyase subunit 3/multisubunit Na+/H+ antiporter MnhD subunit
MGSNILLQVIIIPVITSFILFLGRHRLGKKAGWITAASLIYTTGLLFIVGIKVSQGIVLQEEYLLIAPDITLNLLADGLSLPVALIANLLCTVLAFFSIHYVDHRIEVLYPEAVGRDWHSYYTRFFYLFLFFPVGFAGVALVSNLLTLYFFIEVLTVTLYFLMAYFGYIERQKIAFMCLMWGITSALLILAGATLIYSQTDSFAISKIHLLAGNPQAFWIILVILLGLLTKLAIFPFHVWMPWVHAEHPTCIAGLLAVYANIAVYIMVRILILPLRNDFEVFGTPLLVLALVTMVYGSLLTMAQTDIKRIAACSTISQIAYSVLGVAALTTVSIEGGLFFFLSHIMGKTLFFSTAGIIVYTTGVRDIRQMGGLARKMPLTAGLWIMGAMMLSGFPPFSSFTAEWIMFTGIFAHGIESMASGLIIAVLAISAILLTVGYTFWAIKRVFFGPLNASFANGNHEIKDPPLTMILPLLFVAGVSIFLGIYPKLLMDLLHQVIGA